MIENELTIWKKLDALNDFFNENILDDQVKWEYLKYNIRKNTINFSKKTSKKTNKKVADLETKLKYFEKDCKNIVDNLFIL